MAVRSTKLASGETGAAQAVIYTVPDDRRTILRSVALTNVGPAAALYLLGVVDLGVGSPRYFWAENIPAGAVGRTPEGLWFVLHEDDQLFLNTTALAPATRFLAAGAELVLPS